MTGGWILAAFSVPGEIAPQQLMMIVSGISIVAGAGCVCFINEGKSGCSNGFIVLSYAEPISETKAYRHLVGCIERFGAS